MSKFYIKISFKLKKIWFSISSNYANPGILGVSLSSKLSILWPVSTFTRQQQKEEKKVKFNLFDPY